MYVVKTLTFAQNQHVTEQVDFAASDVRGEFYLTLNRGAGAWVAATVGVEASHDNVNWFGLKLDGSYVGAAGTNLDVEWSAFAIPAFRYIRLWSHNGSGVDVNQTEPAGIPITAIVTRKDS